MDMNHFANHLRQGKKPGFPLDAKTLEFARDLDRQDELAGFRDQFIIPTKASLRRKSLRPQPASNGTLHSTFCMHAGTGISRPMPPLIPSP
jgi:hypothetical protein